MPSNFYARSSLKVFCATAMAMSSARAPWNMSAGTIQVMFTRQASRRHNTLSSKFPILRQQYCHFFALPNFASAPPVTFPPPSSTSPGFKRPEVIEWQENMPFNSATFIGTIIREVKIMYLDSGKIVANSSIKVERSVRDDSWFYLEFWDDLAEVAAAHLKRDDLVFVSGSVSSEKVTGGDGLEKTFAKVVVQDLKFVLKSDNPESSLKDLSSDELWKNVFDNRTDWIDCRESKTSIRYPDFKHKYADIALWISSKYTPIWVQERLEKEGKNFRPASTVEDRWKALFADPSMWWDNRTSKVSPNSPDFRNKLSGRSLWISGVGTPHWVKSQLATLDRK